MCSSLLLFFFLFSSRSASFRRIFSFRRSPRSSFSFIFSFHYIVLSSLPIEDCSLSPRRSFLPLFCFPALYILLACEQNPVRPLSFPVWPVAHCCAMSSPLWGVFVRSRHSFKTSLFIYCFDRLCSYGLELWRLYTIVNILRYTAKTGPI